LLHREISKLYNLIAKIHFKGIKSSCDNLIKLNDHYNAVPKNKINELIPLIDQVHKATKTLYKSCYYPPTKNNRATLEKAYYELVNEKKYLHVLNEIENALKKACLKEKKSTKPCKVILKRIENLTLIKQVIEQLQNLPSTLS
jgi:hypothetical protein